MNVMKMRRMFTLAAMTVCCATLCVGFAQAQSVVFPGSAVGVEGDSYNAWPFDIGALGQTSQHYQQIYNGSGFGDVTDPIAITSMAFRPDASFGSPFTQTLEGLTIKIGSTNAGVYNGGLVEGASFLSTSGFQTVYNGSLMLSSSHTGPSGGPMAFDIIVNFSTPFIYDPSDGNLLLDVYNANGSFTTAFDSVTLLNDDISRIFTYDSPSFGEATYADSWGLVTKFNYEQPNNNVPEPTALGMLAPAASGFFFMIRRRKATK